MSSNENMMDDLNCWTDDLPVCHLSGVGFSTNQVYRPDGIRREEHEFEDHSFHFKHEDDVYLYGIFDGHNGSKVSSIAAQKLPAELLLGQLNGKVSDQEIMDILNQAFVSVEKEASKLIDDALAEKCNLLSEIPEGLTPFERSQKYPEATKRLRSIEMEIVGGTAALVVLVVKNRLYVANIGCSRALLCMMNARGQLQVTQLTANHDVDNPTELERLAQIGVDVGRIKTVRRLGSVEYTRSIGDLNMKRGYRDMDGLSSATASPLIATPEIRGGIVLDELVCFFALMSASLHRALSDAGGVNDHVNAQIAGMIAQQLTVQTTLNGVAQAVVDQVVRRHHDTFMTSNDTRRELCQKREDITLIVRNVSCVLPNALGTHGAPVRPGSAGTPLTILIPQGQHPQRGLSGGGSDNAPSPEDRAFFRSNTNDFNERTQANNNSSTTMSSNTSTTLDSSSSVADHRPFDSRNTTFGHETHASGLQLDEDGRVSAYIDFDEYYRAVAALNDAQRLVLSTELEPKGGYDTIKEERESTCSTPASS